jgi:RHS repeat-associated protein
MYSKPSTTVIGSSGEAVETTVNSPVGVVLVYPFTYSDDPDTKLKRLVKVVEHPYVPQHREGDEKTFLEWSLRDLNGDGYPDFVFGSSPVIRTEPTGQWPWAGPFIIQQFVRELTPETSGTRALYNVAGVRLNAENIFSAAVNVLGDCVPERWSGERQLCGFADVDGDGVQDRLTTTWAYLGAGNPLVTEPVKYYVGDNWYATSNDFTSRCIHDHAPDLTETVTQSLRDINGDGITDKVVAGKVYFGTGTGYAAPIQVADLSSVSSSVDACNGEFSRTTSGLYDMDGDGKPELVKIAHNPGRLQVFYLVGGPGGRNAAGRITAIDNGHGATTRVAYRSVKEIASTVPFPEIVVTSIETVATLGLGGSLTAVNYAYGAAKMYFDPLSDSFTTRGYETVVEVYGTGLEQGQASHAIVRLLNPLAPPSPGMTAEQRFERYQTSGRPSHTFFVGYSVPRDPWILLGSFDPWLDSRRLGASHQDWKTKHLPVTTTNANTVDCEDVPNPYGWTEPGTGLPICSSRGFTYVKSSDSWTGTQAPPGSFSNVESRYEVLGIDDHANVLSFRNENDRSIPDDDVCTTSTYAMPVAGARIFSAVAAQVSTDCGPHDHHQVLRADSWEYDGLAPGKVDAGRVTSHSVERFNASSGASLGVVREYEAVHDSVGNLEYVVTARDDATRSVEIFYDAYGLAPIGSRLDASGLPPVQVSTTRDPLTLAIRSQSDANGSASGQALDGFGRPTTTTVTPSGGTLGVTSTTTYGGFQGASARSVRTKTFADPVPAGTEDTAAGRETITYLDELGRTKKVVRLLGADYAGESLIAASRTYDGLGLVSFEADPFPASQSAATAYGSTYHYGTDGVLQCVIRGNGPQPLSWVTDLANERLPTCQTRVFANHQMQVTVSAPDSLAAGTPQTGVTRTNMLAATGRILSRETVKNGVRLELQAFAYDRLGHMTGLTRYQNPASSTPAPVEWRYEYDSLGQLLSMREPQVAERVNTYSAWGELRTTKWTDTSVSPAAKMRLERTYDALGRIAHSQEFDGVRILPDTLFDWYYDTDHGAPFASTNLVGRLTRTHSPIGDTFVSYDGLGRVQDRAIVDAGEQAYLERYDRHFDGSLARLELKLPDAGYAPEQYHYRYDSAGSLRTVNDGDNVSLYTANSIDAFGRARSVNYGERVTFGATYAETGRRLPIERETILLSGESRVMEYGPYDAADRELGRREKTGLGPATITSTYDALGRVATSASTGAALEFNTTFAYDSLGNANSLIDSTSGKQASLQYLSGTNIDSDRLCRLEYGAPTLGPCNVRHDGSGNVVLQPTQTGLRTLEYFPSGAIRRVTQGSTTATFRYDGSGDISELDVNGPKDPRRTRRYGVVELRRLKNGSDVLVRRIPGAGGLVASRRGANGPYIVPFEEDRGFRFSTDGAQFLQDVSYTPFGESVSWGDPLGSLAYTHEQWNGGDDLKDLGVVNVGARLYDPAIGRFLSRDPLVIPRSASTTNPYTFASNDPINRTDRSGLNDFCDTSQPSCGSDSADGVSAAIAITDWMAGFTANVTGSISAGVAQEYLAPDRLSPASIGGVSTFFVPQPQIEDFYSGLQNAPRGIAYPVEEDRLPPFFAWIYGDPTEDIGNAPPFRILALAAWESLSWLVGGGATRVVTYPGMSARTAARFGISKAASTAAVVATVRTTIGTMGEAAARAFLQRRGFANIRSIQNASGHGLDIVAEMGNATHFFEVKTSVGPTAPALSAAQRNMRDFVASRLDKAANLKGHWKNVSAATSQDAANLLGQIDSGSLLIQGGVINVTNFGTPTQMIVVRPW